MTTSQKAALSLLISVLLFGAFTAIAFTGLFDLIEARFYNPSVTASIQRDMTRNGEIIAGYLTNIQTRFSETLEIPSIKRSFLPNQSEEDIFERSRVYGLFAENIGGVHWIRFIDSGGTRIHYSSLEDDKLRQDRLSVSYRNFTESGIKYEDIAVSENGKEKYIFDGEADRILFSFPFSDSYNVYRGTALFSLSIKAVTDFLVSEGRIKAGQDLIVISPPPGILSGMSAGVDAAFAAQVASIWKEGVLRNVRLVSPDSGVFLSLITVKASQGFLIGRLVNESLFSFPHTMKIILLVSFFLTIYLTIFLLFNLRQDTVTIVQNRMKQLQISLIEQFYERKGDTDWARWGRELELRRDEINSQLKKGLKNVSGIKGQDIDVLIDKSWDELLSVMGSRGGSGLDEEKIEAILRRILAALPASAPSIPTGLPAPSFKGPPAQEKTADETTGKAETTEEAEIVEEVEALEEAELIEEVEEAEAVEEVEAVEEAEVIEEAEAVEEAETAEEVKVVGEEAEIVEAAETETAEEVDVIEEKETEIVEAAETETVEEAEAIEEAEVVKEAETAGDVNAAVVEFEDVENIEELEEFEDIVLVDFDDESTSGNVPSENMAETSYPRRDSLQQLASQIEFSSVPESEETDDEPLGENLEIVSPFSSMLSAFSSPVNMDDSAVSSGEDSFSGKSAEQQPGSGTPSSENTPSNDVFSTAVEFNENNETPFELQSIAQEGDESLEGLSLAAKEQFFGITSGEQIEDLEAIPGETDEPETELEEDNEVIEERGGVHYVNDDVLNSDPKKDHLDRDFKNLVDSVIK